MYEFEDSHRARYRALLDAIRQVETGGEADPANAVGDDGKALGPYQIWRAFWFDCVMPGGYNRVKEMEYAERCIIRYWKRYCPGPLGSGAEETLMAVFHYGPQGAKVGDRHNYIAKVMKAKETANA